MEQLEEKTRSESLTEDSLSVNRSRAVERHQFKSKCGRYIYHVSIIDYLGWFDFWKWGENLWKSFKLSKSKALLISAVNQDLYAKRFVNFMSSKVFINESQNTILNNVRIKNKQFNKMLIEFQKGYADHYRCVHCK